MPAAQNGEIYCPYLAAADSANHEAVPLQALNNSALQPSGGYQLAAYTADSSGNLFTTNTYLNMPKVAVASFNPTRKASALMPGMDSAMT
jgi:hypothetical protein